MCRAGSGGDFRRPPFSTADTRATASGTGRRCGGEQGPTGASRRRNSNVTLMQESNMTDVVIVSAARTAVGKFGGALAKIAA
ncbi:hypothetical protein DF164_34940, partial [Burkholderia stagnalis]